MTAALLLSVLAASVQAGPTYVFTGAPAHGAAAPLQVGDVVTGAITFAGQAVSGNVAAADLVDYSFSVGGFTLSKAGGADFGAHFDFAGAAITRWSFAVGNYAGPWPSPSLVEISGTSADLQPGQVRVVVQADGRTQLGAVAAPGTWQLASPVPEPASAALFLVGGGLMSLRRRRGIPPMVVA